MSEPELADNPRVPPAVPTNPKPPLPILSKPRSITGGNSSPRLRPPLPSNPKPTRLAACEPSPRRRNTEPDLRPNVVSAAAAPTAPPRSSKPKMMTKPPLPNKASKPHLVREPAASKIASPRALSHSASPDLSPPHSPTALEKLSVPNHVPVAHPPIPNKNLKPSLALAPSPRPDSHSTDRSGSGSGSGEGSEDEVPVLPPPVPRKSKKPILITSPRTSSNRPSPRIQNSPPRGNSSASPRSDETDDSSASESEQIPPSDYDPALPAHNPHRRPSAPHLESISPPMAERSPLLRALTANSPSPPAHRVADRISDRGSDSHFVDTYSSSDFSPSPQTPALRPTPPSSPPNYTTKGGLNPTSSPRNSATRTRFVTVNSPRNSPPAVRSGSGRGVIQRSQTNTGTSSVTRKNSGNFCLPPPIIQPRRRVSAPDNSSALAHPITSAMPVPQPVIPSLIPSNSSPTAKSPRPQPPSGSPPSNVLPLPSPPSHPPPGLASTLSTGSLAHSGTFLIGSRVALSPGSSSTNSEMSSTSEQSGPPFSSSSSSHPNSPSFSRLDFPVPANPASPPPPSDVPPPPSTAASPPPPSDIPPPPVQPGIDQVNENPSSLILTPSETQSSPSLAAYKPRQYAFADLDDPSNLTLDESDSNQVKAASWTKLIELLTSTHGIDVDDFLLTYRSFASPSELMLSLFDRFFTATDKIPRLRTFKVLKTWLSNYWQDFESNYGVIQIVDDFVTEVSTRYPESQSTASGIKELLVRKLNHVERSVTFHQVDMEASLLPSDLSLPILSFNPLEIARQLTLREWEIWSQIKPLELLGLSWTKKDKNLLSPNVLAMTDRFNEISGWVTTMVCTTESKSERVKLVKRFVEIADHLRRLGNFNGMMEIVSGLDRGPVYRMKKTFAGLKSDKKYMTMFAECTKLGNSEKNYRILREAIAKIDPPVIPYLGMYLTDLTFTEEGNKDRINGLIHFYKCRLLSQTIKTIKQYQLKGYENLRVVRIMQEKLNAFWNKESALYDLSNYLEPRDSKAPEGVRPLILDEVQLGGGVVDARLARKAMVNDILLTDIQFKDAREWPYSAPDEEGVNVLTDPETQEILSISVTKMIELMTKPIHHEEKIILPFIETYREVLKPTALFSMLMDRYNVPAPLETSEKMLEKYERTVRGPIRMRVYEVLKKWIFFHWNEFRRDSALMALLEESLKSFEAWFPSLAENLRELIVRNETESTLRSNSLHSFLFPADEIVRNSSIFEFEAEDIAQQMTMDAYAHVSTKIDPWYLIEEAKTAVISDSVLRLHDLVIVFNAITDPKEGIILKDRRKKFKTFKCFSHSDAVIWFGSNLNLGPEEAHTWCQYLVTLEIFLPFSKEVQFITGTYWRFAPLTDAERILREQSMKNQLTFSNSNDAPVRSIINYHLSHIANKVVAEISKSMKASMCDLAIREYIKVCVHLEKINNWHSMQAVLCALLQIKNRYPEEWERVPEQEIAEVYRILEIFLLTPMEFDRLVLKLVAPCIPCFGVYFHVLRDVFKTHGPATDKTGLFKLKRLNDIAVATSHLATSQRIPPMYPVSPEIQSFLNQSYRA